jgi:hypothetical protein
MPVKLADEGAGRGREGGQLIDFPGVQEAPVAAGVEQDSLRGIDQVRRDRLRRRRPARLDHPPGGGEAGEGLLVLAVRGEYQRRCPGQAHSGQEEPELERPSRFRAQYPAGVPVADDQQAGAAEPVAADVGHAAAVQAGEQGREGPAPLGAGSAAGVLPHLAPAEADRALPDRPSFLIFRHVSSGAVGFQNSATGLDLGFYAARSYSLRRPPRTGRRLIRSRERSATG